jgi:hypothetical protein
LCPLVTNPLLTIWVILKEGSAMYFLLPLNKKISTLLTIVYKQINMEHLQYRKFFQVYWEKVIEEYNEKCNET